VFGAPRDEDLAALRARIAAMQGELHEKESTSRESRDALRASESAISEANLALRELDARSRDTGARMRALAERRNAAQTELTRQQAAIGRVLAATYAAGGAGPLRLALSGDDPNEAARQLHYVSIVSSAAARVVANYRAGMKDLEALTRAAAEQGAQLDAIEKARLADRGRLLAERGERQKVLDRLAADLRRSRRELRVLQADEARLARLVEEIARVLTARPGAGHVPRPRQSPSGAAEAPIAASGPFSSLRGKLRLPVPGELIGRFGAQHGESSGSRKGVFIRSAEGEQVRAIAAGRVVYADWMRGFGNLLIVDHGEAYLSVYGNNEALLKRPGDAVAAGDPVATVGATGGNEQTGLYFELRHLGKAFDPLRWVGR